MGHSRRIILAPPPRIDGYSIIRGSAAAGEAASAWYRTILVDVWLEYAHIIVHIRCEIDSRWLDLTLTSSYFIYWVFLSALKFKDINQFNMEETVQFRAQQPFIWFVVVWCPASDSCFAANRVDGWCSITRGSVAAGEAAPVWYRIILVDFWHEYACTCWRILCKIDSGWLDLTLTNVYLLFI
jgi:hypothetical protein